MSGSASLLSLYRWVGCTLAAGAVVAAAGCSSSGGSSTSAAPPMTSAAASTSAPASTGSVAGSSPASSTAPSSPASGLAPRATGSPTGGSNACATQGLRVALGSANGAAGSAYLPVQFTNVSGSTCTLYGYPGVSQVAGTPLAQVGAAATRSTAATPSLVTLAPGKTANALLRVVQALNYPTATCSPIPTTKLRIYPPNQTTSVDVPFKSTGCMSTSVKLLTIGVVQPGAGSGQ